jgi:O-methyltransferase
MSALTRIPRHVLHLGKALGVAYHNMLMDWARSKRQDRPNECFPSDMIHLSDPHIKSKMKYLNRGYADEAQSQRMIGVVEKNTMATYDGMVSLIDQVRFCEEHGIAGAYVELGTWKGGCMGLMAQANLAFGKERRMLHGFDSFEGLPRPRADKDYDSFVEDELKLSPAQSDGELKAIGALLSESSDVERLLARIGYPADQVRLHVGWFQNTIPAAKDAIGPIAILRMDGDFYDSYMIGFNHLWDNVVPGGFMIFDDWVLKGCREAVAEFFAARGLHEYVGYADATVRYVRKTGR